MNATLRNKCDHARRVGFRIAVARGRVQAEVMVSRCRRRRRRPDWMFESAGDRDVSMRAMSMWSDHGAPVQRRWWKTRSRRSTRSSTGLKILLAAGTVVAGVIGVSGVYPHVIDAEWVQGARTYASRTPAPDAKTTTPDARTTAPDARMTRRSDIPAPVQAPPRSTAPTTAAAATPRPTAVVPTPVPAAVVPTPVPLPRCRRRAPPRPRLNRFPWRPRRRPSPRFRTRRRMPMRRRNPRRPSRPSRPLVKRRVVRAEHPRRSSPGPFAFGWGGSPFRM